MEARFPPDLELRIFAQHARLQPLPEPQALLSEPQWQVDETTGALPQRTMSWMAHSRLVPVEFKQQVLQVENHARQSQQQMRQLQMQPGGGLIQMMMGGGAVAKR